MARYPQIRLFSVWNEPNGSFTDDIDDSGIPWDDISADAYYHMSQIIHASIKATNKYAIVTGPVTCNSWAARATSDRDLDYIARIRQLEVNNGGQSYIDWLDVHTYPHENDPQWRVESMAAWLINKVRPIYPTKPIIVSEFGVKGGDSSSEALKAEAVARAYFALRTVPNIRGVSWYELITSDRKNMGLVGMPSGQPAAKPAFYTYQDVAKLFRRGVYRGRDKKAASGVWFLKFTEAGREVYVAWRETGSGQLTFKFTATPTAGDLQVRPVKISATEDPTMPIAFKSGGIINTATIDLGTRVKYIRVPAGVRSRRLPTINSARSPELRLVARDSRTSSATVFDSRDRTFSAIRALVPSLGVTGRRRRYLRRRLPGTREGRYVRPIPLRPAAYDWAAPRPARRAGSPGIGRLRRKAEIGSFLDDLYAPLSASRSRESTASIAAGSLRLLLMRAVWSPQTFKRDASSHTSS